MRLPTTLPLIAIAWAGLASSQCLSSIPRCAQVCIINAATQATKCSATNWACQCTTENHRRILQDAQNCAAASCGEALWLETVMPAADAFCNAINGGETCSSTSTRVPTTTTSSSTPPTSVPASSSSASGSSPAASSSGDGTATGTATGTTTDATSSSIAAAAASAGPVSPYGMIILGALALVGAA